MSCKVSSLLREELRLWDQRCATYAEQLDQMLARGAAPEAIEAMRGFLASARDTRDGLAALFSESSAE